MYARRLASLELSFVTAVALGGSPRQGRQGVRRQRVANDPAVPRDAERLGRGAFVVHYESDRMVRVLEGHVLQVARIVRANSHRPGLHELAQVADGVVLRVAGNGR